MKNTLGNDNQEDSFKKFYMFVQKSRSQEKGLEDKKLCLITCFLLKYFSMLKKAVEDLFYCFYKHF